VSSRRFTGFGGGNLLIPEKPHPLTVLGQRSKLQVYIVGSPLQPKYCLPLGSGAPLMNSLSFSVGDKVVYPNHGVGIIEQVSSRTIGSQVERFYLLKIKASSLKVMVPFHNVESVGLRKVVRNGEVVKIIEFLSDGKCENNADWKYRFKENSDKMRTGSLLDVAIVLKGLLLLAQTKSLSFREKKMLERTRYLLVSELAMSRNVEESVIEELLDRALSKSKLRFPEASAIAV
jgi:CarD family transcriptional regulator